ncbi:MAG: hypothetical protein M1823_006223 [Watsoniomyces obsoletus]|nr:MAG: hypothetical protein M1823_006223 [Watsoniomyces obsoletus]
MDDDELTTMHLRPRAKLAVFEKPKDRGILPTLSEDFDPTNEPYVNDALWKGWVSGHGSIATEDLENIQAEYSHLSDQTRRKTVETPALDKILGICTAAEASQSDQPDDSGKSSRAPRGIVEYPLSQRDDYTLLVQHETGDYSWVDKLALLEPTDLTEESYSVRSGSSSERIVDDSKKGEHSVENTMRAIEDMSEFDSSEDNYDYGNYEPHALW